MTKTTSISKRFPNADKLYATISEIIEQARNMIYRTANSAMVQAYWNIGRTIVEEEQAGAERAQYGTQQLKHLSGLLSEKYGKGFDESNLRHMRHFYKANPIQDALRPELSWTHYRMLLKVEDKRARSYYMEASADQKWSTRDLERQLSTQYYERILANNPKQIPAIPIAKGELELSSPSDVIKDPVMLEFLDIKSTKKLNETKLEEALMNQLQEFLLELGKGFSFVGRQYRVGADTEHFYIDLVFYNYHLKCFVLIDLKTGKLNHQDIGQMDFYVRYFEDQVKLKGDNPTIGLILCAKKDNAIAKYSLLNDSKQIFASQYKTYLPSEEELQKEIERGRHQIELENKFKK